MSNIKKFGEREELAAMLADAGWEVEQAVGGLQELAESWVVQALNEGEALGRDERRELMAPTDGHAMLMVDGIHALISSRK